MYIPDTCHAILIIWYLTPLLAMFITWYLTPLLAMLITWYLTPVLVMLYLSLNIWHRYLSCYTYHLISDTGTCHAILIIWYRYRYMPYYTYYLISDTGTCHAILIACYLTPDIITLDMLSPGTGTLDPICDTCIILHIHDYYFWDLAWLLYCYQIFGTPVLLNSCTPELLYSWTPEKRWLLILYSC